MTVHITINQAKNLLAVFGTSHQEMVLKERDGQLIAYPKETESELIGNAYLLGNAAPEVVEQGYTDAGPNLKNPDVRRELALSWGFVSAREPMKGFEIDALRARINARQSASNPDELFAEVVREVESFHCIAVAQS